MPDLAAAASETSIPLWAVFARMGVACALSFFIGLDREYRRRPAGLRTIMLTALASSAFVIISIEMVGALSDLSDRVTLDPIRVIEAVTAGVAFLAAGTIIVSRGEVKGLTTGAGMWAAGAIGIACGGGYFGVAIAATIFAVLILVPMNFVERHLPKKHNTDGVSD